MKYLVFLFWIPALIVLYLSGHQEILKERRLSRQEKPRIAGRSQRPQ